jgi:MFS family permease
MALNTPLDPNTPGPPGDESKTTLSSETTNTLPIQDVNIEKSDEKSTVQSDSSTDDDDEAEYPRGLKLALIILSLNLATFLVGLDNTILSSAIPKITDHFHALNDVGWYASAYLLTNCSFQLMWGKLLTFYSVKWVFLTSLFIFELGSLICAVAPTSTALIIGRAIAGVGSGGGGTGGFILIARSVPRRQRPTLVGLMGAMYGFASIAGPLLGGVFTDSERLTWRFCFYINLPLGFITIVVVMLCIPTLAPPGSFSFKEKVAKMDIPGTICLFPGVICLLLGLEWGGSTYPWNNGRIIALLVLGVVLLSAFVVIQARNGDHATVPPRVFCNRNIWGSSLFGCCITAAFFVMLYYVCTPLTPST